MCQFSKREWSDRKKNKLSTWGRLEWAKKIFTHSKREEGCKKKKQKKFAKISRGRGRLGDIKWNHPPLQRRGRLGILVLPMCFIWFTLHTKLLMILFDFLIVLVKSHAVLKFFPITPHFIPYPVGSRFTAVSYLNRPSQGNKKVTLPWESSKGLN